MAAPAGPVAMDETFHAGSLFTLRTTVASRAAGLGLSEQPLADFVLVAHELAANAVRHGGATERTPARLRLWREGDRILCQVEDRGPGFGDPEGAGRRLAPAGALDGRGLWIVRQIVDRLDIASGPAGARVRVTVTVPASPF
jgi:anti-sigma regulatory factor (Ser/Thr protein kinase)